MKFKSRRPTKTRPLSVSLTRFSSAIGIATAIAAGAGAARAAQTWDGSTSAFWNDPTNWSGMVPGALDDVMFNTPLPGSGPFITLPAGATANSLNFMDTGSAGFGRGYPFVYDLTGGNLTLTTGSVYVDAGADSRIDSILKGTAGLTKTGIGILTLGASNTYTGTTTITTGGVLVAANGALGTSTVVVTGNATKGNPGGSLIVGAPAFFGQIPSLTVANNLSIVGNGIADGSGTGISLNSVGNNTFTGAINFPAGLETRITSTLGTETFNGPITNNASTNGLVLFGIGNYVMNGGVSGTGQIIKTGTANQGTLVLNGSNTFTGLVRIDNGFVRVSNGAALGNSATFNVNFNTGTLEVRTNGADATNSFTSKNIETASSNGTVFVDHSTAVTSANGLINTSVNFGNFSFGSTGARTLTLNGRDGYGVSFTGSNVGGGFTGGNPTITNNLNGLLTINGGLWGTINETAARTLTIGGNGDTLVTGSILGSAGASSTAHILTKTGIGTLTIQGSSSVYGGATNINQGTLSISSFGATGTGTVIKISNANTTGLLLYTGGATTTSKTIDLGGTSSSSFIQTGSGSIVFSSPFTATGAGSKSLWLQGSTVGNEIQGAIVDNSATNITTLQKQGTGTWTLSGANTFGGAGAGTAAGQISIDGGTLRLKATSAGANIINDLVGVTFNVDQANGSAAGTLDYTSFATGSSETMGRIVVNDGAGTIVLNRTPAGTGTGAAFLRFTNTTAPTRAAGGALNFVVNANGGVNGTDAGISITGQASSGFINQGMYFNGADFAAYNGTGAAGFVRALAYGSDAGTSPVDTITAGNHTKLTTTPAAQNSISLATLNLSGASTSLNLNPGATLTYSSGGLIKSGGGAGSISGGATIGVGTPELSIRTDLASDSLTIATPIVSGSTSTAVSLTKSGAGTLVLTASNTYLLGVNSIDQGTIQLSGVGNLGSPNNVLRVRTGATLDLGGVPSLSVAGPSGGGLITTSGAGNSILNVGTNSSNGTWSGLLADGPTGTISVTKNGTGTFIVGGTQGYTGVTTVNAGTLAVQVIANGGVPSGLGMSSSAAANLVLGGTGTGILQWVGGQNAAALSTTGAASVSTDRLFSIGGNATIDSSPFFGGVTPSGAGTANNATLIFANTGAIPIITGGTKTLTLQGSSTGDNEIASQLSDGLSGGTLNVTKAGAGLWVLSNVNTYDGITSITGGTLRAVDGVSLPSASTLVINGGILESSGLFARFIGPNSGQFQLNGTGGFAASTANLTVSLNGGAPVVWGATNFLPSGNLILGSATSLAQTDFASPIDLGTGFTSGRTIQVNDNTNTSTDIARISGAISDGVAFGDAIILNGNVLQLTGSNSYSGNTWVQNGTLVVMTVGGSLDASNLGSQQGTLKLGNAANNGTLFYVGGGETATRSVLLPGTTGGGILDANGTGPLVLTGGLAFQSGGNKTLTLQGASNLANEIDLTNIDASNAGTNTLTITKTGTGTWILSGTNPNTGTINANGGMLGIGSDGALGSGTLSVSNGTLFAAHGDHIVGNNISFVSNTNINFVGANNLTFNGNFTMTTGANGTLTNNVDPGTAVTFSGATFNIGDGTSRNLNFNGSGATVINAAMGQSGTAGATYQYSGTGSLTLNGANTFTGAFSQSNGTVIAGSSQAFGAGSVNISGGTTTANTDLTGTNAIPVPLNITGTATYADVNNIEFAGTTTNSGGNRVVNSNLGNFAALTFSGPVNLSESTIARTLTVGGSGNTVISGPIRNVNPAAAGVATGLSNLTLNGTGTLTLSNPSNTYLGTTTIASGTLSMGVSNAIPSAATNLITFNPGSGQTATLDLNGTSQLIIAPTSPGVGTSVITNSSASDGILTVGAQGSSGTFSGTVTQSNGNTDLYIVKTGAGTVTLSGAQLDYQGKTTVSQGILNITGSPLAALQTAALQVNGGATFNTFNNAGQPLSLIDLNLGLGGGTSTLGLELGTTSDTISASNQATVTGIVQLNLAGLPGLTAGNYSLLSDSNGGLLPGGVSYVIGALPGGFSGTLSTTDNLISINLTPAASVMYWTGKRSNSWQTVNAGPATNWSTDIPGAADAGATPGPSTTVNFSASNVTGTSLSTTLDANFTINDLRFNANPAAVTSVTIAAGTPTNASLTIAPASSSVGINVASNAGAVTISAPLVVGADQTWSVGGSSATLTVSGGIAGTGSITMAGLGKLIVSAAASGYTGSNVSLNGGSTEAKVNNAFGSTTNISVGSGGLFFTSGSAGTIVNSMTLNGGTIGIANSAQTYSGNISLTANSSIKLLDLSTPSTSRNITLNGTISGTSQLSLDSVTTVGSGNQITGTLTINGSNTAWSGGLELKRGLVISSNASALGSGLISFNSFGKLAPNGPGGTTWTLSNPISLLDGAIGEINGTNASTAAGVFNLVYGGQVSLGTNASPSTAFRVFQGTVNESISFTGGIVLNNNASITTAGNSSVVVISGTGISETGGSRVLSLQDNAGSWGQTATTLEIDASGSFTGGTNITGGTVRLGVNDALGSGVITIAGGTTIQAGTNLTGANAVANNLTLSNSLTVSGTNSFQDTGIVTQSLANRVLTNNLSGSNVLSLSNSVLLSESGTGRVLTIAGSGTTLIGGLISDNGVSGTGPSGITKSGTGTLIISHPNNAYTGATTMSGTTAAGVGVLRATASLALGTGPVTLQQNTTTGQFQLDDRDPVTAIPSGGITLPNNFTTSGTGLEPGTLIPGLIRSVDGSNTITGTVTMGSGGGSTGFAADAGASLTFTNVIQPNTTGRQLIFTGSGTINLSATSVLQDNGSNTVSAAVINMAPTGLVTFGGVNAYSGPTNVNSGTLQISNANSLGLIGPTSGTVVASGAALELNNIVGGPINEPITVSGTGVAGNGAIRNVAGNNSLNGTLTLAAATTVKVEGATDTLTIQGGISGSTQLTKSGPGTLSLNGDFTASSGSGFTGNVQVAGGTLKVTSAGALDPATTITSVSATTINAVAGSNIFGTVNNGGTLIGGGGALGATIGTLHSLNGSEVNPGAIAGNAGTFNVVSGISLDSGSHITFDLNGLNPGSDYDQLVNVTGIVSLGAGSANVSFNLGYAPLTGDHLWLILNTGTTTGSFNGYPDQGLLNLGGQDFRLFYHANFNTNSESGGNDVLLEAVPEPSVMGSIVCGIASLLGFNRLRRRRQTIKSE